MFFVQTWFFAAVAQLTLMSAVNICKEIIVLHRMKLAKDKSEEKSLTDKSMDCSQDSEEYATYKRIFKSQVLMHAFCVILYVVTLIASLSLDGKWPQM